METVETLTLDEYPNYRARLEYDDSPEEPYDDGATPILRLTPGGYNGYSAEAFNKQAAPYVEAANRLLYLGQDVFERYLKAFHGTVNFESYFSSGLEGYYIAFDTAAWRDEVGAPVDLLKGENYLSEVIAWAEGDVYGIIIERKVSYTKTFNAEDLEDESGDEWQEVNSCWGFYGSEYAEEAALDMLKAEAK